MIEQKAPVIAARDANRVQLTGAVATTPKVTMTHDGYSRATFSMATLRTFSSKKVRHEEFDYHNVIAWEELAKRAGKLEEGDRVTVYGYLQTRSWPLPEGVKQYRTQIVAENLIPHS